MQREAKFAVRHGSGDRILKIVQVRVALVAKVEPRMGILMREDWVVPRYVLVALVVDRGPLPRRPGSRTDGMGRRSQGQQVDHHQLAVMRPAHADETRLRVPAHAQSVAVIQHPIPIDTLVDLGGQLLDLGVQEVLARSQDTTHEDGRVN